MTTTDGSEFDRDNTPKPESEPMFGWPLRDPGPDKYQRIGLAGLWLNAHARAPRAGEASPAVLLIPGAYHGAWCYGGYLDAFDREGVAAAALDLRGHGARAVDGLSTAASVNDYIADACEAARWLAQRHERPPVILGHSLGGLIAAAAAAQTPASGLLLLAPSPPGNLPGAAEVPEVPTGALRNRPADQEVHLRFLGGLSVPDLSAWADRLCPESPTALNDRYRLRIPVPFDALRGLPGLCIEAGLDDAARHPAGQDAAIAKAYGIEYKLLEHAPHCMMVGPSGEESFRALLQWWRRL
jgi:pimeloyl-ACP methyl ester carboxylesterase